MRNAIITGGGSGIGQAIALRMAQDGDHLVILDLNQEAGEETVSMIKQAGGSAECHECDVSDTDSVRGVFDQVSQVDVLINSAGIFGTAKCAQW